MKKIELLVIGDYEVALHMLLEINEITSINRERYMDPQLAIQSLSDRHYDLVLVDNQIPGEDSTTIVSKVREKNKYIPVIMMINVNEGDPINIDTLRVGVTDFWDKKGSLEELKIRIQHLVLCYQHECKEKHLENIKKQDYVGIPPINQPEEETMDALMRLAKYKDQQTVAHTERVGAYANIICKELKLEADKEADIVYGAKLHDIGKVGIPDVILNKKGTLTKDEYELLKQHTWIGYDLLGKYKSNHLKAAAQIALTHHERYDGFGYPRGLKGDEIPLEGRIVAIIDTFDALVTERPYKQAWSIEDAIEYLVKMKDTQFDSELVDLFIGRMDAILEVYHCYRA